MSCCFLDWTMERDLLSTIRYLHTTAVRFASAHCLPSALWTLQACPNSEGLYLLSPSLCRACALSASWSPREAFSDSANDAYPHVPASRSLLYLLTTSYPLSNVILIDLQAYFGSPPEECKDPESRELHLSLHVYYPQCLPWCLVYHRCFINIYRMNE